jgi:hypothetical protein
MADFHRSRGRSRRRFLGSTLSVMGAALVFTDCNRSESPPPESATVPPTTSPPTPVAEARPLVVNAHVPAGLVFSALPAASGLVRLTTVKRDAGQPTITFEDAHGRAATFNASASFADGIRTGGKVRRQSVAPKVLASYILDATWQIVRRESGARGLAVWAHLQRDFARLQEQSVLDNISVGAVVAFVESIAQHGTRLRDVTWDEQGKRIVASFV